MFEGFKKFDIQTSDPQVKIHGVIGGKGLEICDATNVQFTGDTSSDPENLPLVYDWLERSWPAITARLGILRWRDSSPGTGPGEVAGLAP